MSNARCASSKDWNDRGKRLKPDLPDRALSGKAPSSSRQNDKTREAAIRAIAPPRHRARHRRLPRGRVVEITGPSPRQDHSALMSSPRRRTGRICGFIDAEHALDTAYARSSVDPRTFLSPSPTRRQGSEIPYLCAPGAIGVLSRFGGGADAKRARRGLRCKWGQARLMSQPCASSPARSPIPRM